MDKWICSDCDKKFTCKRNLDYHISNKACKKYTHYCKFCDKGFTSEISMNRHVKEVCPVKKKNDDEKNEIYEKLIQIEEKHEKELKKK